MFIKYINGKIKNKDFFPCDLLYSVFEQQSWRKKSLSGRKSTTEMLIKLYSHKQASEQEKSSPA